MKRWEVDVGSAVNSFSLTGGWLLPKAGSIMAGYENNYLRL
jgi:hypothetical protein